MSVRHTETDFELTTIERLEALGYEYVAPGDLDRTLDDVVLMPVLRAWLAKRYPALPERALDDAVAVITRPNGVDNRLIDAAAVVRVMLQIKKDSDARKQWAESLGLSHEELDIYDAVAENFRSIYDERFLCDLIHDVVATIKRGLKVDWTAPHRDAVKAEVRAAVKRVLRKRQVREEDFEPLLERVIKQAEALFADWPSAA